MIDVETAAQWARTAWREELASGGADCPDDPLLAGLFLGEEANRDTLVGHVLSCRRCAGRLRDLGELHREVTALRDGVSGGASGATAVDAGEAPVADAGGRERSGPVRGKAAGGRRGWPAVAALAAAMLLALGLVFLADRGAELAPGPGPESPADDVVRSPERIAPVEPPDGAVLGTPPSGLAWKLGTPETGPSAEPTGGPVVVRLFDAEATELWSFSGPVPGGRVDLPLDLVGGLGPGAYFWIVERPEAGERFGPWWWELRGPG